MDAAALSPQSVPSTFSASHMLQLDIPMDDISPLPSLPPELNDLKDEDRP